MLITITKRARQPVLLLILQEIITILVATPCRLTAGTFYSTGYVAEQMIFNGALTTSALHEIADYLSMKYGLTLAGSTLNADTLTGGLGADTFRWTNASYTGTTGATRDVITDFSGIAGGQLDKIDIAGMFDNTFVFMERKLSFKKTVLQVST